MKKACAKHCKRKVDTMPSSPSDHDMSDSSSSGASYVKYSPYNSPSQQVPQLTNELTELTCVDKRQFLQHGTTKPFLRITEQPQNHFRFRYISEMVGTHGCLLGKSYSTNKTKTHPTVELVNYNGQALIRCQLAQHDNPEDHPHKLLEDEQDRDVSQHVPEQGSYKVAFGGIGIIHTAKKDVSALLLKKFMEQNRYPNINLRDLQTKCDNMAKSINLNIVRLKFSAHDGLTGEEICEPVFSELIHNMKSASTNDLKICRMSCSSGSASGGEDVFILVEKVNKKNIMIRFYELDMNGERTWEAIGQFMQTDVHHQYAIVFRTPSYKDRQTPVDVEVFIELVRPSDGRTSEPKTFKYRADPVFMQKKKRKANSSVCSIGNSPNGSLNSSCDIPITVINQQDAVMDNAVPTVPSLYSILSQAQMVFPTPPSQCDLGSALAGSETSQSPASSPMWGAPHAVLPPTEVTFANLQLNSAELADMLQHTDPDTAILSEGMKVFFSEYLKSCSEESPVDKLGSLEFRPANIVKDSGQPSTVKVEKLGSLQFRPANIVKDSGRPSTVKVEITDEIQAQSGLGSSPKSDTPATSNSKDVKPDINKNTTGYDAFYNTEDGTQVKKLIKDLCDMIRNKKGYKKQEVRSRLERLFNIRLSNGDTFLHMTLCSNLATLDYIVKIIHNVKATHLLDYYNLRRQTPLHVAILNDAPKTVALLVSRGASPMMKDEQGLNAIHYAVKYKSCLIPLLDTIKKYNVMCDLDDTNRERQSALHLAVVSGSETSAEALLRAGASHAARDSLGRTPLHIAAYDDRLAAIRTLLQHIPLSEVDVVDDAGNTALQIVCGGQTMRENTIAIATLLLEKKANPLKTEEGNESAWRLVRHKPELKALLEKYVGEDVMDDIDVKSEPDDDFESADEGEYAEVCLGELSLYLRELAARLDAAGAWRDLAARLRLDALTDWYGSQPSPTRSLLAHLKDSRDDISSKSLMLILEDMGQTEAADVIRRYIE